MAAKIRSGRRPGRPGAILVGLALLACASTEAQPVEAARAWRLVADGDSVAWTAADGAASEAAARALAHLQRQGYLLARIDSARESTLYATRGPAALVAALEVEGADRLGADEVRRGLSTRLGQPFDPAAFDRDMATLADRYARAGRPLAVIRPELVVEPDGAVRVRLAVEEGGAFRLGGVELLGGRRTRPGFAARAAGLDVGTPIARFEPEAVRRDLLATGVFDAVGDPVLVVRDTLAFVRVPVREAGPGLFDLVLGYLPGGGPRGEGAVVGSGQLELRNVFGGGRVVRLALVRDPGLTASVDFRASDPYLFGLPLRVEARFEGYTQDSLFARQRLRGEVGYRILPGLELTAATARERVEPGDFGASPVPGDPTGRPRVAEADALSGGFGLRYARVDAPLAPRRGLLVEAFAERGRRRRSLADSVAADASVERQRLEATVRGFVPTLRRQSLVVGVDARVLLGGREAAAAYDEGELFRIGGARSLRGYDENAFLGDAVGRVLAEYRYALDPESFALAFVDLGYVARPPTVDGPARRDLRPGYGVGVQYRTPLGLVSLTYALNPEIGFAGGKVHVGLAFGL